MKYLTMKWSHYLDAYREEFARIRIPVSTLLEIGIAGGGSLEMWRQIFPETKIVGLDVDPRCRAMEKEGFQIEIGDQTDRAFLRSVVQRHGPFSIIVDDGGHWPFMQRTAFRELWPALSFGGCYAVEDLHTAYAFPLFWGGRGFFRFCYALVDAMNGYHFRCHSPYRGEIRSVNFRDSLVFVYKDHWPKPYILDTSKLQDCRGVVGQLGEARQPHVKTLMFTNLMAKLLRRKNHN